MAIPFLFYKRMPWYLIILHALLRLFGLLPLSILHVFGAGLGWLFWIRHGSLRRDTERTLTLAHLDGAMHDTLVKRSLIETGKSIVEITKIWTGNPTHILTLVHEVNGKHLFEDALANQRGLIIAAPHLGCWEILNQYLASKTPLTIVYRSPRQAALEPLLLRARNIKQVEQVRAEGPGVRTLYRRLQAGGVVGILPDQQPKQGEGEFAPFFGTEALTMVLLSRLAARTGAQVLFSFAERLPNGAGYRIHFLPAPADIAAADQHIAVNALNRGVEQCIRLAINQYQWHYKRYSIRPPGDTRRLY